MSDVIQIKPCGPVHGAIRPPGSKSVTNRALVCAALARGTSALRGALDCEDTQVMIDSLQRMGRDAPWRDEKTWLQVEGAAGGPQANEPLDLYVANSGTTMRFLTALVSTGQGKFRLDGVERMRQRPIHDLLQALSDLGAAVQSEQHNGCPPVIVDAHGLTGGTAQVRGDISSQFLSGLLMAAPAAKDDVEIAVQGELVSKPYVEMTLAVMRAFGATVHTDGLAHFRIPAPQSYAAQDYFVEPDASAASYFWAAAAISGGKVTVEGLTRDALQGDVAFCDCLEKMGCEVAYQPQRITVVGRALRGVTVNMNAISDTVQTLAVTALFADGPTTIRDVAHIRHKETDRIGDLARELRKLGAEVKELGDGLTIIPGKLQPAEIETYNDHRMAMSFALAGLRIDGVSIRNPACTQKTYPTFFEDFQTLCQGESKSHKA